MTRTRKPPYESRRADRTVLCFTSNILELRETAQGEQRATFFLITDRSLFGEDMATAEPFDPYSTKDNLLVHETSAALRGAPSLHEVVRYRSGELRDVAFKVTGINYNSETRHVSLAREIDQVVRWGGSWTAFQETIESTGISARGDEDTEWVPCTPNWIRAGGNCARTPRRRGIAGIGHEHRAIGTTGEERQQMLTLLADFSMRRLDAFRAGEGKHLTTPQHLDLRAEGTTQAVLDLHVEVWADFRSGLHCSVCGRTDKQNKAIGYDCATQC